MDRRTWLAISLCFLIFVGWQKFYIEPRLPTKQPDAAAPVDPAAPPATTAERAAPAAIRPAPDRKPEIRLPVEVGTGTAQVSNGPRFFTGWELKSYRLGIAPEAAAVSLESVTQQTKGEGELAFDIPELAYLTGVQGTLTRSGNSLTWTYEDENVKLVRLTSGTTAQNYADVRITAEFKNKRPNFAFVSLFQRGSKDDEEARDRKLMYWTKDSIERVSVEESIGLTDVPTGVRWIGASSRYFLMSLISQTPIEPRGLVQPTAPWSGRVSMVFPVTSDTITIPLKAYFGPKELNVLRSVDPTLDHTVDLGFFTFFAYPLLRLMKWFYELFHNWGVAIIVLTLLVKIVTYPLTYKSMKSMKEMARLQPQLQKLREKHANDREALNREMMSLMRTHGYNPMAGCLPILVQMPVFFALYNVLYSATELYHAPFMLWIQDLSSKDPYYVTPVLLTATMFIQQKVQPATTVDPMQQKMMQFMPIMFGAFMITLPAGLTLYMVVNAITSIIQQLFLNKKLGSGNVPAAVARGR